LDGCVGGASARVCEVSNEVECMSGSGVEGKINFDVASHCTGGIHNITIKVDVNGERLAANIIGPGRAV
jgi:hypothetical protein